MIRRGMLTGQEVDGGGRQALAQPQPTPTPAVSTQPESTSEERTYTYVKETGDLRGGDTRDIWTATQVGTVTGQSGLTELYDSRKEYEQLFGSVDNFIDYMDQMYDLQQANPEIYKWWETSDSQLSLEEFAQSRGYPAADGLDPLEQQTLDREYMDYQRAGMQAAYESMINSEEYKALSDQYGLSNPVRNQDGDIFMFNGGFPVEIMEVQDHLSATDYAGIAAAVGLGLAAGPAVSSALGGGLTGGAAGGMASSAATQLVLTGEIDPTSLAVGAVSGAFQGIADAAAAGESLNAIESVVDNAAWDLSGILGVDHNTANNIMSSAAQSIVAGNSAQEVAAGIVGQYGADVILANANLGDLTTDVQNLFREGETEIPHEAVESLLANALTAGLGGDVTPVDVAMDYFQEGGSLGFLTPSGFDMDLDINIPISAPFDFDLSDVIYPEFNELINLPEPPVDLADLPTPDYDLSDVEYPAVNELINVPDVDIDTPDATIDTPDATIDLPDVDIDIPNIPLFTGSKAKIPKFNPYTASIGYQPVQLLPTVGPSSAAMEAAQGMLLKLTGQRNA